MLDLKEKVLAVTGAGSGIGATLVVDVGKVKM
jgi:NADP-dependent 3-hydroxy acid dehydrogenase YdfG